MDCAVARHVRCLTETTVSEPVEVLLKRLTAISRGRETPRGFHFFCQIGSAQWHAGVTTLQISGTGWVLVSHRPHGAADFEDQLYSCYMSTRDLRAVVTVVLENPFWDLDTSRWDPEGEETNVHMRLMDTGRGFAWDTQIWSGERKRQGHFDRLLRTLELIVDTASEGSAGLSL